MTWGNDGVLAVAREPLDTAIGQIDPVSSDAQAGVGPGLAFARARLAQDPDRRLILVPCAKGGSAIAQWAPAAGRDSLFGSCVDRAASASRHGRLTGVLWYQGESDTRSIEAAVAWPAQFETLVIALRNALDRRDLPVIAVSLADPPMRGPYAGRYPAWSQLQAAQSRLSLAGVVIVDATGLPKQEDDLHLSTAGQLRLGGLMAAAIDRKNDLY